MNHKASLLLDIDNTLVDRDAAFGEWAQQFIDTHAGVMTIVSQQDQPEQQNRHDRQQILQTILALDCHGKTERMAFCRALLQHFPALPYSEATLWTAFQQLPQFVRPDPAVIALLQRLSLRFQLLVISNGSGSMQRRKLQQAGLAEFFTHVVISGEVGCAKPAPAIFSHALALCASPQVLMIGDDYHNDMQPAMALGLKTIFINPRQEPVPVRPDRELASVLLLEEALTCLI